MNTKPFYNSSIPADWTTPEFGEVFSFLKTFSFSREQLTTERTTDGIQNIHYGDIHATFENEILDFEIEKRVPYVNDGLLNKEDLKEEDFPLLKDGDLIIADASEDYVGVAECVELQNINGRKVVGGLHTFVSRDKKGKTSPGYRTYILKHPQVVRELRRIATGFSVFGISKTNLEKVRLPLPPNNEQKAIADLLHLMDTAINKNNLLIEKKLMQKKWLMQMLLTGKKRLKGFGGEWEEYQIKDVFGFVKSYSHSRDNLTYENSEGSIYNIHYGDIHAVFENDVLDLDDEKRIPFLRKEFANGDGFEFLKDGDVIIADASEDYEGVGESVEIKNIRDKKVIGGLHTIVLRDNSNRTVDEYRAFLFNGESVLNALRKVATGISVYGISKSNIASVKVILPSTEEQTAIASVLQAADKEIQLLKLKSEKLREEKKGLMQILLTGKKRLTI